LLDRGSDQARLPCNRRVFRAVPGALSVLGFGFQVSGFWFRVSGFWFRFLVCGYNFRVSGFRCRVSVSGFWLRGSGFGVRAVGYLQPSLKKFARGLMLPISLLIKRTLKMLTMKTINMSISNGSSKKNGIETQWYTLSHHFIDNTRHGKRCYRAQNCVFHLFLSGTSLQASQGKPFMTWLQAALSKEESC